MIGWAEGFGNGVCLPSPFGRCPPRMVKKLMRHLGNKISRGCRGARETEYPLPFHRFDPRALETGSRCPFLGHFAPRDSRWQLVLQCGVLPCSEPPQRPQPWPQVRPQRVPFYFAPRSTVAGVGRNYRQWLRHLQLTFQPRKPTEPWALKSERPKAPSWPSKPPATSMLGPRLSASQAKAQATR